MNPEVSIWEQLTQIADERSVQGFADVSGVDRKGMGVGRLRGQPYVADQTLTSMTIVQATEALRGGRWAGNPDMH